MKVRNRKTGEIVDIIAFSQFTNRGDDDYVSYIDSKGVEHDTEKGLNYYWDFEPVDNSTSNIDWEQRRYELAKAAMQGLLANTKALNTNVVELYEGAFDVDVAYSSIKYADALIEKLKEK